MDITIANDSNKLNQGIPANSSVSHGKTLVGPEVGIGLRTAITDKFTLDLQANYTWYGTVAFARQSTNSLINHKVKIRQAAALASLAYTIS